LIGGAAAWPPAGLGQGSLKRRPLIALVTGVTTQASRLYTANFFDGLRELGYVEGRDFDMVYRIFEGYQQRLRALGEELVRLKPDVILATAVIAAVPARNATSTTRSSYCSEQRTLLPPRGGSNQPASAVSGVLFRRVGMARRRRPGWWRRPV